MAFKSVHESPRKKRLVLWKRKYVWLYLGPNGDDSMLSGKRETYDMLHKSISK